MITVQSIFCSQICSFPEMYLIEVPCIFSWHDITPLLSLSRMFFTMNISLKDLISFTKHTNGTENAILYYHSQKISKCHASHSPLTPHQQGISSTLGILREKLAHLTYQILIKNVVSIYGGEKINIWVKMSMKMRCIIFSPNGLK